MALSRFVLTSDVQVPWPGAAVLEATPAVPASTVAVQNASPLPAAVTITGGTITAVVVNGITVGAGAGTYLVPAAGAISVTYSAAPAWAWAPVGSIPAGFTAKFVKNQVICADSAGAPFVSGAQQLFQAIGASNLRAFVQGQDDVGHAGLGN